MNRNVGKEEGSTFEFARALLLTAVHIGKCLCFRQKRKQMIIFLRIVIDFFLSRFFFHRLIINKFHKNG